MLNITILSREQFKLYELELLNLFTENFFTNGGMLYSDDFLINSDFIIIAQKNNQIVAYMAVCKLTEEELDRKYETYQEEPNLENSILIKHLVVKKKYRKQNIASELLKYIKNYSLNNEIKCIYLWTTLNNMIALNFYKKQGFYKMGDFNPANGIFHGLNNFHSIMMVYKGVKNEIEE